MKYQSHMVASKPVILLALVYFYLVLFAIWPFYFDFRAIIGLPINPERLVLLLLPCALIFSLISFRWREYVFTRLKTIRKISLFFLLFIFSRFLSSIMSENPAKALERCIFELFSFFFLFHIGFLLSDNRLSLKWFKIVLMILAVILAVFGVLEWTFEENFLRGFIKEGASTAADVAYSYKFREGIYRTQATFEHPLPYAQYLLLVITLCFMPYLFSKYGIFAIAGLLICISGAMTSGSRTGLVGVALAAFAVWWFGVGRESLAKLGFVLQTTLKLMVLALLLGALFYFIFKAGASASSSTMTRVAQLYLGIIMILQSPIWGFGPGQSGAKLLNFEVGDVRIYNLTIDNYFLTIMLESGFLGLFSFVILFVLCFKVLSSVLTLHHVSAEDKRIALWHIGWFFAMVGSIFILSIYTVLPMIFFCLGLVVGDAKRVIAANNRVTAGVGNM